MMTELKIPKNWTGLSLPALNDGYAALSNVVKSSEEMAYPDCEYHACFKPTSDCYNR